MQGHYQLRIDLEYWNGTTKYAIYKSFRIGGPEEKYKLQAYLYSGDAGKIISGPAGEILVTKLNNSLISQYRYYKKLS